MRELIRNIQDLRKKEKLTPHDMVDLVIDAGGEAKELVTQFEYTLKRAATVNEIYFGKNAGEQIKIDDLEFVVLIKR